MGSGVMPFDDALSLNTIGLRKSDFVRPAFGMADLVLLIGYDTIEFEPVFWNVGKKKVIVYLGRTQVDPAPGFAPDLQVIGDLRRTLRELTEKPLRKESWAAGIRADLEKYMSDLPEDGAPVKPQLIVKAMRNVLGREDIAVSDVGMHLLWMARRFPVFKENTLLVSNGLIPMGFGVPAAIASKMCTPESVCGAIVRQLLLLTSNELNTPSVISIRIVYSRSN